MRSNISKHSANRNYNSPLKQENSISTNLSVDKERKSLNPSLNIRYGDFGVNANGNISPKMNGFDTSVNYEKNGFNASIGLSSDNKTKPNIKASVGYTKKF